MEELREMIDHTIYIWGRNDNASSKKLVKVSLDRDSRHSSRNTYLNVTSAAFASFTSWWSAPLTSDSARSAKSPILFAERCTIARRKSSFNTLDRFQRLVGTPTQKLIVPDSHCFVVVNFLHVHSRWMSKQNGVQEIGLWQVFWLFWSVVLKVLFLR